MDQKEINNLSKDVQTKGVVSLPRFLDSEQLETIQKIIDIELLKSEKVTFPVNKLGLLKKIIKLDFSTFKNSISLLKISENLNLKKIAEDIFGSEAELYKMDTYISKKSDVQILPWHNDIGLKNEDEKTKKNFLQVAQATFGKKKTKFSARGIKFFIYMTDVSSKNGALGVMPYSHHIVKSLTNLILEDKIPLKLFWGIENLKKLVLNSKVEPLVRKDVGDELFEQFLKNLRLFDSQNDTFQFDQVMHKGGTVLFDELCVHRGSQPSKNNRIVLRFLFKRKLQH